MAKKRQSNRRKIALFIDVANVCELDMDWIVRAARRQGQLEVARAYGSFTNWRYLTPAAERLFLHGVRLIHCPAWRNASGEWKDCADELMMDEIYRTLNQKPDIDRFIICTGDGHFVPATIRIRATGREAIIIAPPDSMSRMLAKVASRCLTAPYSETRLPLSDEPRSSDNGNQSLRATWRPNVHSQASGKDGNHRRRIRTADSPPLTRPGASLAKAASAAPQQSQS